MDEAVGLVQEKLAAGEAPMAILGELQDGMGIVGDRFEAGEYYLSELIFAGEIFKQASAPLQDALAEAAENAVGTIVLGTVKNDIHEFGKNIAGTVLSSNGIRVVDLGVDVDPQAWVDAINESGATLVGMSALLTTVFDSMKEVDRDHRARRPPRQGDDPRRRRPDDRGGRPVRGRRPLLRDRSGRRRSSPRACWG